MNLQSINCMCSVLAVSPKTRFPPFTEEEVAPLLYWPHQKVKEVPREPPTFWNCTAQLTLKQLISHKSSVTDSKREPSTPGQPASKYLTYFSRNTLATEAKACCDIEAVHRLQAIMALRSCDIDGHGQENRDIHGNDRPGSGDQQRSRIEWPFREKFLSQR